MRQLVDLIRNVPQNGRCADCSMMLSDSIWASVTYGAFICIHCAGVHRKLGVHLSRVKSIHMDTWNDEEIQTMQKGNKGVNEIYERYIQDVQLKPSPSSSMVEREEWIRAKYEQKIYMTPSRSTSEVAEKPVVEVAKRLVDYFVVIGKGDLVADQDLSNCSSPIELRVQPSVIDQYPENYKDSPLPSHIAQFAFPEGYNLSLNEKPPSFFSFVLTNVAGIKMYACALTFYEVLEPVEVLSLFSETKDKTPPSWIDGQLVYAAKCILLLSHYPYFSAFRQFLQQVYRLSLSLSPIPIERYIANFTREVPLPPHGQVQVQMTLPDRTLTISRPPVNQLPLTNYPFRPLFQLLDIDNIMTVFTCLVLEQKIAFCSKYIGLLTPIAEAFQALLFPFTWQGVYIPVLPSSLLDVLDAPIPFLVGLHSNYLLQKTRRPIDVTFVDLDHNRIILAVDDFDTEYQVPKLPERDAGKLKASLFECAAVFCPFAPEVHKVDLAFQTNEYLEPIGNFASERGITMPKVVELERIRKDSLTKHRRKTSFSLRSHSVDMNAAAVSSTLANHSNHPEVLVDSCHNESDRFSTEQIRRCFLRFFTSILRKYANYLVRGDERKEMDPLFDTAGFLRDSHESEFLSQMIESQMFQRFCEERIFHPTLPEVRFFDESIREKLNRSVSIGLKKKLETEFLNDTSNEINETFVVPPPSTLGLPDDGTVYQYHRFPRLKDTLFGQIRQPRELFKTPEQLRHTRHSDFHQQVYTLSRASTSWQHTRLLVTRLQAQYRMYRARKNYLTSIQAIKSIQEWTIANQRRNSVQKHFQLQRSEAIVLQRVWRGRQDQKKYQRLCLGLLIVQRYVRKYVTRRKYQRFRKAVTVLQACLRRKRDENRYRQIRCRIIFLQALFKGWRTRSRCFHERNSRVNELRNEIFQLWNECSTSLVYRSKFWLIYNQTDYLNLGVHLEELKRLQISAEHHQIKGTKTLRATGVTKTSDVKSRKAKKARSTLLKHATQSVDIATARLYEERLMLYRNLKTEVPEAMRKSFFRSLDLGEKSKKKKRTLVQLVWTDRRHADMSAQIVLALQSTQPTLYPVDFTRQDRIRRNLADTVRASFLGVPIHPSSTVERLQERKRKLERELEQLQKDIALLKYDDKEIGLMS